jgi:hypothetical protein
MTFGVVDRPRTRFAWKAALRLVPGLKVSGGFVDDGSSETRLVDVDGVRWMRRLACVALAMTSIAILATSQANAYLYVGDGSHIARANNDGSGLNPDFISVDGFACGVAVDSGHIYWSDRGSIGRANLDGTGIIQNFVSVPGMDACGVAVNGAYLFWADRNNDKIGRANIDGTSPNAAFATPGFEPSGVAADASYVYYASTAGTTTVQRASATSGALAPPPAAGSPASYAVAVDGANLYYGNRFASGSTEIRLVNGASDAVVVSGAKEPSGIAVSSTALYWLNHTNPVSGIGGSIGTASIDSSGFPTSPSNQELVTGLSDPYGIAVDSLPIVAPPPPPDTTAPQTTITKAKISQSKRKATFKFSSSEPASMFECKLDKKPLKGCTSPKTYKKLKPGKHKFKVVATDKAGNADPTPAVAKFKIKN